MVHVGQMTIQGNKFSPSIIKSWDPIQVHNYLAGPNKKRF